MLRPLGRTGRTSWMVWLWKPRLNSAVARVATETWLSFSRVCGFRSLITRTSVLVDLGLTGRRSEPCLQEVEVAALVGLLDVLGEHPAVAAPEARRRRHPFASSASQFVVGHPHVEGAVRNVHLDDVAR